MSPAYAEEITGMRRYCPTGTVVKRKERPPVSVLIGAGSIYRIVPCTEAVALKTIEDEQRAELMVVALPINAALPAPEADDSTFDECGRCVDCGKTEEYCRCE